MTDIGRKVIVSDFTEYRVCQLASRPLCDSQAKRRIMYVRLRCETLKEAMREARSRRKHFRASVWVDRQTARACVELGERA